MVDLTKAQVASLLALHGYDVPEPDLTEIVHRLNALIDSLQQLDGLDVYHVEPLPVQPVRRLDHA
jgi:Asp-tRNA(Asn)/Glu-tRNA(Gln) amidotransferase C subunit